MIQNFIFTSNLVKSTWHHLLYYSQPSGPRSCKLRILSDKYNFLWNLAIKLLSYLCSLYFRGQKWDSSGNFAKKCDLVVSSLSAVSRRSEDRTFYLFPILCRIPQLHAIELHLHDLRISHIIASCQLLQLFQISYVVIIILSAKLRFKQLNLTSLMMGSDIIGASRILINGKKYLRAIHVSQIRSWNLPGKLLEYSLIYTFAWFICSTTPDGICSPTYQGTIHLPIGLCTLWNNLRSARVHIV